MTKEKLEKEAEEWIKDHSGLIGSYEFVKYDYDSMQKAYLAGAEPREKRIAELEQENERLKGDLELWESGACRATNLDKCGVVKELKAQIEKMKWHDLRKDPNDLPKETGSYVVSRFDNYLKRKKVSQTLFFIKGKGKGKGWQTKMDKTQIIAWCEIPQFY